MTTPPDPDTLPRVYSPNGVIVESVDGWLLVNPPELALDGCTCDAPVAEHLMGRPVQHAVDCPASRPSPVLDLDATHPPRTPRSRRQQVLGVRMDPTLAAWVREQAHVEHCAINAYLLRLIRRARTEQLPADVRDWLTVQAAQCGTPGDPDAALIAVIRHLADRWPNGARLNP